MIDKNTQKNQLNKWWKKGYKDRKSTIKYSGIENHPMKANEKSKRTKKKNVKDMREFFVQLEMKRKEGRLTL